MWISVPGSLTSRLSSLALGRRRCEPLHRFCGDAPGHGVRSVELMVRNVVLDFFELRHNAPAAAHNWQNCIADTMRDVSRRFASSRGGAMNPGENAMKCVNSAPLLNPNV